MEDLNGPSGPPGPAGLVRGEVRAPDGAPVPGARVSIIASPVPVPDIAAVTDQAGRFVLAAPAAGRYTLAAHADGVAGGPATGAVSVPPPAPRAGPPPPAADPDADVGSDEPLPERHPADPVAEVRLVLTFGPPPEG